MAHSPHIIRRPRRVQVGLPVPWLERVAESPGEALHVGTALHYLAAYDGRPRYASVRQRCDGFIHPPMPATTRSSACRRLGSYTWPNHPAAVSW